MINHFADTVDKFYFYIFVKFKLNYYIIEINLFTNPFR